MNPTQESPILQYVTEIVSSHLGNNTVAADEVPAFIRRVYETLTEVEREHNGDTEPTAQEGAAAPVIAATPAVPIGESITPDYLICLEDGKKLKMLKRYLMAQHGLTPEQYRAKWGLPDDYPMTSQAVSDRRRGLAASSGLGRRQSAALAPKKGTGRHDDSIGGDCGV